MISMQDVVGQSVTVLEKRAAREMRRRQAHKGAHIGTLVRWARIADLLARAGMRQIERRGVLATADGRVVAEVEYVSGLVGGFYVTYVVPRETALARANGWNPVGKRADVSRLARYCGPVTLFTYYDLCTGTAA